MKKINITINSIKDYSELISNVKYTRLYDALEILKKEFPELNISITNEYDDNTCSSCIIR